MSKDQKMFLAMGVLYLIASALGTAVYLLCDKNSTLADFLPHWIGSAIGGILVCTLFYFGSKIPKKDE